MPNPIDIDAIELITKNYNEQQQQQQPQNTKDNMIIKVAHYPYYKNYRSDDQYSDVLIKLQNDRKCKIVTILNMSHEQTLKTMASCDLVIGKILPGIGWFGKFELEGMAMGKPVIAYISDDLYEKGTNRQYIELPRVRLSVIRRACLKTSQKETDCLERDRTMLEDYIPYKVTINTVYECYNKLMR